MQNVYQLKDTDCYINKDFSEAILNIRIDLLDEVKQLREEVYHAIIKYDGIVTNKRDEVARE